MPGDATTLVEFPEAYVKTLHSIPVRCETRDEDPYVRHPAYTNGVRVSMLQRRNYELRSAGVCAYARVTHALNSRSPRGERQSVERRFVCRSLDATLGSEERVESKLGLARYQALS